MPAALDKSRHCFELIAMLQTHHCCCVGHVTALIAHRLKCCCPIMATQLDACLLRPVVSAPEFVHDKTSKSYMEMEMKPYTCLSKLHITSEAVAGD